MSLLTNTDPILRLIRGKAIGTETKCRVSGSFQVRGGQGTSLGSYKAGLRSITMLSAIVQPNLRSTGRAALQCVRQAAFSTSSAQAAQQRNEGRDASRRDMDRNAFDITGIQKFQFDDTTSYGHMILEKKREKLELLRAIERDRSLLERE